MISKIYCKKNKNYCKKTGMAIILIVLGSKEDYKTKRSAVRDSSMVPHMPKIFIRISNGKNKNRKILYWHKNKQVREYSGKEQEIEFKEDGKIKYIPSNHSKKIMDISELTEK